MLHVSPLQANSLSDFTESRTQISFCLPSGSKIYLAKPLSGMQTCHPAVPAGSRVQLTPTGLNLTKPQGQAMWTTGELQGDMSYAEMRDDGNFVLASSDSSYLWQSFNNPSHTLLPNQTLPLNGTLSSRFSQTNYTKGRFELYFNGAKFLLSQIAWPTEFHYNPYHVFDATSKDSVSGLVFNSSGNMHIGQKRVWDNLVLDVRRNYYRATLDYYGVFTLYSHPKESNEAQVWSVAGYVPNNICEAIFSEMGSGSCGYNSYCSWDDNKKRPTCKCPGRYSLVDPNDEFGGCKPDFSFGCGADYERSQEKPEEVFEMKPWPNVNWPLGDYERLINYSLDECIRSCLYDCNCAAVIPNPAKDCWKKRFPLSNGRYVWDHGIPAYLKTRIQPLGNLNPSRLQPALLLGSPIGSLVVNTLLVATVVSIILLKSKNGVQVSSFDETKMHSFTYEALKEATHGFNEEVGRGSFGIVYKGTLNSMINTVVAVKRLERLAQ